MSRLPNCVRRSRHGSIDLRRLGWRCTVNHSHGRLAVGQLDRLHAALSVLVLEGHVDVGRDLRGVSHGRVGASGNEEEAGDDDHETGKDDGRSGDASFRHALGVAADAYTVAVASWSIYVGPALGADGPRGQHGACSQRDAKQEDEPEADVRARMNASLALAGENSAELRCNPKQRDKELQQTGVSKLD